VVITATSATGPLIEAGWLGAGTHVTAVGADMPHKQELDPDILATADEYVPDSMEAAAECGELHHAIEAKVIGPGSVYGELGALASGRLPGRSSGDEITVAELTGLGVQDAALVTRLAEQQGVGRHLPLGDW
jgi:ornithine cyclodeaminase